MNKQLQDLLITIVAGMECYYPLSIQELSI